MRSRLVEITLAAVCGSTLLVTAPSPLAQGAEASKGPWQGYIYMDVDGKRGAEKAIKLTADGKWELQTSSGRSGLYDVKLAGGSIGPKGELEGLPDRAFLGAKVVWKAGIVETLREGKAIPTLAEVEAAGAWKK